MTGKNTWVVLVAVAALLLPTGVAAGQTAADFADWTQLTGSPRTAIGTLHGQAVSVEGTGVAQTGTLDGSSTIFNRPEFTPPLPTSDTVDFSAVSENTYTRKTASRKFGIETPSRHITVDPMSANDPRRVAAMIPAGSAMIGNDFDEALRDNMQTPIPDQVQFRIDFPAWARRLPDVKRRLVEMLARGHRTKDLAVMFRLSEARISQLRKEFHAAYTAFCDGIPDR